VSAEGSNAGGRRRGPPGHPARYLDRRDHASPGGRYRQILAEHLPPGCQSEHSHQAQWRTLHAAELAGGDARQVVAQALGERDLTGARDVAAVIDARIRRRKGSRVPVPQGTWSQQVPEVHDKEQQAYLAQLAGLMDER